MEKLRWVKSAMDKSDLGNIKNMRGERLPFDYYSYPCQYDHLGKYGWAFFPEQVIVQFDIYNMLSGSNLCGDKLYIYLSFYDWEKLMYDENMEALNLLEFEWEELK